MRRLIFAVMIVLLPLRGLIGDAMAMEAVVAPHDAIHSIAAHDEKMLGSSVFSVDSGGMDRSGSARHCQDHADATDDSTVADRDPAAHGSTCTVCQVCHTVAMSADAAPLPALPRPALVPEMFLQSFTSAQPAPGLKPPIS